MTAKQDLVAHLEAQHGLQVHRGTHKQLTLRHKLDHESRHLTHNHAIADMVTGNCSFPVRIALSPPKNPSSNRNGDRNWVVNISQGHTGWRYEIPGTRAGDPEGAINEANKLLGWVADWEPVGWGWRVMDV